MRYFLCLVVLLVPTAFASNNYFYVIRNPPHREIQALTLNGQSYRQVPGSPYPWPFRETDRTSGWPVYTIPVSEPGPFLYATRSDPFEVYGYRRLPGGGLEELPGFPLDYNLVPGFPENGPFWVTKHPHLPVIYMVDVIFDQINISRVEESGMLTQLPSSPVKIEAGGIFPISMVIHPDGTRGYLSMAHYDYNGEFRGILSFKVDPVTGDLYDFERLQPFHGSDQSYGMAISEDGRYLYVTTFDRRQIYGFAIEENRLVQLPNFPRELPFETMFPYIKDHWLAIGSSRFGGAALWRIQGDGQIELAPGSPFSLYFTSYNIHAAFTPDGKRIAFCGAESTYVLDIAPDGRLSYIPQTAVHIEGRGLGISVAPEITGDPYSLVFDPLPEIGDRVIHIVGEPNTTFFLVEDEHCTGPFVTDESGRYTWTTGVQSSQSFGIKAYCDEPAYVVFIAMVPTLSGWGLLVFVFAFLAGGLTYLRLRGEHS